VPLYEIEGKDGKRGMPPRQQVRRHYAMTRQLVEEKIAVVTKLPNIEQMIPRVPSTVPVLPAEYWGYIRYPYNIVMQLVPEVSSRPIPTLPRVKTV